MTVILGISGKKQSGKTSLANFLTHWVELRRRSFDEYAIIQELDGSVRVASPEDCEFEILSDGNVFEKNHRNAGVSPPIIKIYSFADALKDICIDVLGLSYEQVHGTDEQKNSQTRYKWENLPNHTRIAYSNEYEVHMHPGLGCMEAKESKDKILKPRSGFMTAREVMQIFGTDIMRRMFHDRVWVDATFNRIAKDNPDVAVIADTRFPSEINALIENGGYVIRLARDVSGGDSHPSETSLDGFDFDGVCGSNWCHIPDVGMEKKNEIALSFIEPILLDSRIIQEKSHA